MKRKGTPPTPQSVYHLEKERARRQRDDAFERIMNEARVQYEAELEAGRVRGRGGRPRGDRTRARPPVPPGGAPPGAPGSEDVGTDD